MSASDDVVMGNDIFDHLFQDSSNNYDEIWGHSFVHSTHGSRTPSMSLSEYKESYAEQMEKQNDIIVEKDPVVISNGVLSLGTQVKVKYVISKSQLSQVSKASNSSTTAYQQHALIEDPTLNQTVSCNMFNIQLNYDLNQALDLESWDGNFYVMSLYKSMEHIISDAKNIKDSLFRKWRYILGNSVKDTKINDVKNLEGISKVIWEFISTIYNSQ